MDNQMKLDLLMISIHANANTILDMNKSILENNPDLPEEVRTAIEVTSALVETLIGMNQMMHDDIQQATSDVHQIHEIIRDLKK